MLQQNVSVSTLNYAEDIISVILGNVLAEKEAHSLFQHRQLFTDETIYTSGGI